ncbi:MAG TPA: hypothetical protein VFX91_06130 [Alcanivorax sp.]|nr:hypothetical protein [Alcanivorax sp.]
MIITMTRVAPQQRLLIITLLALFATMLSAGYLISVPQLGVAWQADEKRDGLTVADVAEDGPNAGRLTPGVQVIAVRSSDGGLIPLNGDAVQEDPDLLSYERYNAFLAQQNRLMDELKSGKFQIVTQDQQVITLHAENRVYSEAITYLLIKTGYGWVALLVAVGVWAYNPHRLETRLFCLSGVSAFLVTLTLGTYGGRELAISGDVLSWLMAVNHLAVLQVWASLTALFCVYPLRKGRFPLHRFVLAAGILAWLADQLQLGPGPEYSVYSVVVLGFFFSLTVLARQWRLTRNRPLERASLKWCAFSIFVGCMLLISLIMLPPVLGVDRTVPLYFSLIPLPVLYLGMAAGLTRYRLFDLEQWWFKTWIWFFGGVLVVVLDLGLIFGLGLAGGVALSLSLALAGWIYFPLRQALMRRLGRSREHNFNLALKKLVDNLFSATSGTRILSAWPDLLKQTFSPLSLSQADRQIFNEPVSVSKDGGQLIVSPLEKGQPGLLLEFADDGRRLFTPGDLRIAQLLRAMSQQALSTVRAREDGAEAERLRIVRDLHDDVGARLLTLLHTAPNTHHEALARNALVALRETLYAMDDKRRYNLADLLEDWRSDLDERLAPGDIHLDWSAQVPGDDTLLTPRHYINLRRILDEAVTNALKHGAPTRLAFHAKVRKGVLHLSIINDIRLPPGERGDSLPGRGLNNMQTRIKELGGRLKTRRVTDSSPHFHLEAQVQLTP